MQPHVLIGHLEHPLLEFLSDAQRICRIVFGGEVLPVIRDIDDIAVLGHAHRQEQHLGLRQARQPAHHRQRGRLHAKERQEDRVARAVVHVGKIIKRHALPHGPDDGPQIAVIALGNQDRIAKPQAPLEGRLVPGRVGLGLIERAASHAQIQGNAGRVKPGKVRSNHDDRLLGIVAQKFLVALKAHHGRDILGAALPQDSVIQRGPAEPAIGAFGDGKALLFGFVRKAQSQVGERHLAPFRNRPPQDPGDKPRVHGPAPDGRVHHGLDDGDPQFGKPFVHSNSSCRADAALASIAFSCSVGIGAPAGCL